MKVGSVQGMGSFAMPLTMNVGHDTQIEPLRAALMHLAALMI